MTKGLVRYQQCGCFHFITFSCYRRPGAPGLDFQTWDTTEALPAKFPLGICRLILQKAHNQHRFP